MENYSSRPDLCKKNMTCCEICRHHFFARNASFPVQFPLNQFSNTLQMVVSAKGGHTENIAMFTVKNLIIKHAQLLRKN
jgi:hypothetical protein